MNKKNNINKKNNSNKKKIFVIAVAVMLVIVILFNMIVFMISKNTIKACINLKDNIVSATEEYLINYNYISKFDDNPIQKITIGNLIDSGILKIDDNKIVNPIDDEIISKETEISAIYDKKLKMFGYIINDIKCGKDDKDEYFIIYDANGGTDAPDSQIKTKGDNLILNGHVPIKDGRKFIGWNTKSDGTGKKYLLDDEIIDDDNIILYAQWGDFMHSISSKSSNAPDLTTIYDIWGSRKYRIFNYKNDAGINGTWVSSNGDPQIIFDDVSEISGISGAYIELEHALNQDVNVNVFYATNSGLFNSNNRTVATLSKGSTKLMIPFTHGTESNWTKIRFDIGNKTNLSYKIKYLGLMAEANQWNRDYIILRGIAGKKTLGTKYWQYTFNVNAITNGTDAAKNWRTFANSSSTNFITPAYNAARNGYTYIRTCDRIGNCSDKTRTPIKIDLSKPTGAITKMDADSVKLSYSDNNGVIGYYWGTSNPINTAVKYTSLILAASGTISKSVNSGETYYFAVKDVAGNVSEVKSIKAYKVSYSANGGSGVPASQTKLHGSELTLSSNTPNRKGYVFLGWGTSSSSTDYKYKVNSKYNDDKSITLYAIWKPKTLTVTYHINGGTGTSPVRQTFTYGVSNNKFGYKTDGSNKCQWNNCNANDKNKFGVWYRTGYEIVGWNRNKNATTAQYSVYSKVTDDWIDTYSSEGVQLYAVWKEKPIGVKKLTNDGVIVTVEAKTINNKKISGYYFSYSDKIPDKSTGGYIATDKSKIDVVRLAGTTYVWVEYNTNEISNYSTITLSNNVLLGDTKNKLEILKGKTLKNAITENGVADLNKLMARSVRAAGLYTKEGAATAAATLTIVLAQEYKIKIPYQMGVKPIKPGTTSGYYGAHKDWGSVTSETVSGHKYFGLDCDGFVNWSYTNTGYFINSKSYYDNKSLHKEFNGDFEVGDVIRRQPDKNGLGHVSIIIGKTNTSYIIAEAYSLGQGIVISTHDFNTKTYNDYQKYNIIRGEDIINENQSSKLTNYPSAF